jgi:oxygen-independent coproporphyrinogen-3 oxidase
MDHELKFDAELISRYDRSGPRYTSYPTAVQFHEGFTETHYRALAESTNEKPLPRPLSLYIHIPFCTTVCFYCACNKIATKDRSLALPYLDHLYREISMQGGLFNRDRPVDQLHWGGGTPTFLNDAQMAELMVTTAQHFHLHDNDQGEYSIEIDPREATADTIRVLRQLGFNRISLGVQDFNPRVQKAVNRIQSEEQTLEVMRAARQCGFKSISLDLIYGLPFQTVESFERTLERVISASPDRISVFNYAHLPTHFKPQRRIDAATLPEPREKLGILKLTIEQLTAAGYVYIGMDHFAKPDDELTIAQRDHKLHRNFQGYSTHADCDLIGLGITAIGAIGNSYSQNVRAIESYYLAIDQGNLPILRGTNLSEDDQIRRKIISELICHFSLDLSIIEQQFKIDFKAYFAPELHRLVKLAADELISWNGNKIFVLPKGRLLIRNLCMVFDHYLPQKPLNTSFSKVI